MISPSESGDPLPHSRKVYVPGKHFPFVKAPFREIDLSPTKAHIDGSGEINESVRVYDTSGPWGDPDVRCEVRCGLPALRAEWISGRGDVEEYEGRNVQPEDNGYLTRGHEEYASRTEQKNRHDPFPGLKRKVVRATGRPVTQLWYARQGIVTPEMEFVAIRENLGRDEAFAPVENKNGARNVLIQQHPGSSFGASIPKYITPELSATKLPAAGRSSPRTSITPNSSR